jgi:hypothetical protein
MGTAVILVDPYPGVPSVAEDGKDAEHRGYLIDETGECIGPSRCSLLDPLQTPSLSSPDFLLHPSGRRM